MQINIIYQTNNFPLSSTEARAVREGAEEEIGKLRIPVAGIREGVVLYWHQARNAAGTTTGDRAIIESVSRFPVRTAFRTDDLKCQMLFKEENPFTRAYVVDVMVETVQDKPVLYTILALHDVLEMPSI